MDFKAEDNKKFEIKIIIDSTVYNLKANNQMSGFYYLFLLKSYPIKKNT